MANKFPKKVFIKFEDGGNGPDYMVPHSDPIDAAEMGQRIKVGVYTLTETVEVKGVAVTNTISKHKTC